MQPLFSFKDLSNNVFLVDVFPSVSAKNNSKAYKVTINGQILYFRVNGEATWVSGRNAGAITNDMVSFVCALIESDTDNSKVLQN